MFVRRGFTVIEVSLVVSLIFIVGAFFFPLSISFLQAQVLDEHTDGLVSALRKAQAHAFYARNDSAFGIKILSESYVLFQGTSYASRTTSEDQIFTTPDSISMTGLSEIVFAEHTGLPDVSGTITVSLEDRERRIDINAYGRIER